MKKLLLLIGSVIFVVLFLELSVRFFYQDLPEKYISIFDTFYQPSNNQYLLYTHIPDWEGYATGVRININSSGLRNPEVSSPAEKKRILIIGDSMIFGFGLKEDYLISRRLENMLNKKISGGYEVINAGVCGYNLVQNFENLKFLYDKIKPDYVLFTFIHNDIEGIHYSENQTNPIFKSAFFPKINRESAVFKLYNFFINEDIYKHPMYRKGMRYFLINNSRLYLFVALRIKNMLIAETGGELPNPYLSYFPEASAIEKIVLNPLKENLRNIKLWMTEQKLDYSFVVLNSHQMSGDYEYILFDILNETEINYSVLEPFIDDFRRITLGWDPHPNRIGAKLYAELLFDVLNKNDFINSNAHYHFNKSVYDNKLNLYRAKIYQNKKKSSPADFFSLNENIKFLKYTDYSYYPVYGIYNDNLPNLDFKTGKSVSKYLSILLKNDNKDKIIIKGRKISDGIISADIYLNNRLFKTDIVSADFSLELLLKDIDDEKLDVFMEFDNYSLYNGNPVTFIIEEIGLK